MPHLDLETRTGLPDALRVLLAEHPRAEWPGHRNFHGLVSFWLDRHLMFRRLSGLMRTDCEAVLDKTMDTRTFAARLARLGGQFVNELHGHHQIEDAHYFPALSAREARLAAGFELLDSDHHALDRHLGSFAETANAVLRDPGAAGFHDAAGRFHGGIVQLEGFLDRHLTDEEDLIVPVILRHGAGGLG